LVVVHLWRCRLCQALSWAHYCLHSKERAISL